MKKSVIMLTLLNLAIFAQAFTDPRDGKTYKTVKIGTQTWMAQNMNYNSSGSSCYDNNSSGCEKFGRLYNWEAAKQACPVGWHLPSDNEWQVLVNYVRSELIAGKRYKSKIDWDLYDFSKSNPNDPKCKWKTADGEYDHCASDDFGFSALPGGYGSHSYFMAGNLGYIWSSTEFDEYSA
ncbi:MAG: hypothetical protein FWC26_10120, partial [Fibromonadales bacterium]|nr:hypothetical protein [Fibromonadales bacterium]